MFSTSPIRPIILRGLATMAAAGTAVTAAHAVSPDQQHNLITRSVTVSYADLDLSSEAGRNTLETRLRLAAKKSCGTLSSRSIEERTDYSRCMTEALDSSERAKVSIIASYNARNKKDDIQVGG